MTKGLRHANLGEKLSKFGLALKSQILEFQLKYLFTSSSHLYYQPKIHSGEFDLFSSNLKKCLFANRIFYVSKN